MAGSSFGTIFRITTWGESHGEGLGVVVDGCPAGIPLCEEDIQKFLNRRKPGQSQFTTPRKEGDLVHILSGVFEGRTTGTPISCVVWNENQRSKDYSEIANYYRPGHADFTFDEKYGFRDYRGGGRSSGRETIGRVIAGAIAQKALDSLQIRFCTYAKKIGPVSIEPNRFDVNEIHQNALYMPDAIAAKEAASYLETCMEKKDSCGGIVECVVTGLPTGLGETVFDKLDAELAKAIFSIGAVKGFEIGDGFASADSLGSSNNDAFFVNDQGKIQPVTNHAGGVLGGMSTGAPLVFCAAIKPTPSIASQQHTVTRDGSDLDISIRGRHDPIIVPRAVVVIESMAAITILDLLLRNMTARMDQITEFYKK